MLPLFSAVWRITLTYSKVGDFTWDFFDEDLGKSASETGFGVTPPDHFPTNLAALWSTARTCLTQEAPSPRSESERKKASSSKTPTFAVGVWPTLSFIWRR